jgi:DNA-binding Lrp family transcriptional regulator
LKYDERIDNAIINELSKNLSCPYRELKRKIEKHLQKTISFDVYNLHIRKLLKAKILGRNHAEKRGKKVLYSIPDEAKRQIQLKLIAHPKQSIFRKIYEKFFFYEVHYSPRKVISSEKEFDKLLSELNITRKKLKWWLWSGAGAETNEIIARELYGNPGSYRSMSARTRQIHKKGMKTYWLMKAGQSRSLEHINFICSFKKKTLLSI